jgi:methylmalonyl-CoA/ethylmalonyl-CoA epimerase
MKIEKIDHVAILVRDLKEAEGFFSELFNLKFSSLGEIEEVDARSVMDSIGIELIEPLKRDGPTSKVLQRRGEGLILISLKVSNLDEAMAEMKAKGIRLVAEKHGNVRLALYHPKDLHGVMIELIEYETGHPLVTAMGKRA